MIVIDDVPQPRPEPGEVLVRVAAAGVGPWDALIREHKSAVKVTLPLILGADFSGVVEGVGPGVSTLHVGQEVYGVTNPDLYTQFAIASAKMVARKPLRLSHAEAASAPVVAVTAWQMLFDYADAKPTQRVLIHGAAGNVGAYAVQLASHAGLQVFATAASEDVADVRSLGAAAVIDYKTSRFENAVPPVDAVIDTVGGDTRARSFGVIKPGGVLVTVVSEPLPEQPQATKFERYFSWLTSPRRGWIKLPTCLIRAS